MAFNTSWNCASSDSSCRLFSSLSTASSSSSLLSSSSFFFLSTAAAAAVPFSKSFGLASEMRDRTCRSNSTTASLGSDSVRRSTGSRWTVNTGVADRSAKSSIDQPSSNAARPASIDPFKAMNVPCPRLCGARFGRGGGGMIVFHNGDVKTLWSWFQTDQTPGADVKQQQRQNESVEVDFHGRVAPVAPSARRTSLSAKMQQSPRTMLDLMRMNTAAKIAQWGVEGTDDDSDSDKDADRSDDESGVSDDSSHSSSESEEFESFFLQQTTAEGGVGDESTASALNMATAPSRTASLMMREKSDDAMVLSSSPPSHRFSLKRSGRKFSTGPDLGDAFINPTDHLAPVVIFTLQHDAIIMNDQCPELADGMEFGPWGLMVSCMNARRLV